MKRLALAGALALLPLPAAHAAAQTGGQPAARDWTTAAERTPEGGIRIGNPNARVKMVEYLSLSCPHCAQFAADSQGSLWSNHVRTGAVSVEYRNFVLNGFDMAAAMLSRCAAPRRYFDMTHDLLAHQADWLGRSQTLTDAQRTELGGLQPLQAMQRLVPLIGLDRIAARHGIGAAELRTCMASQANLDQLATLQQGGAALGVTGTPSFFINGQLAQVNTWAGIEPLLRAR